MQDVNLIAGGPDVCLSYPKTTVHSQPSSSSHLLCCLTSNLTECCHPMGFSPIHVIQGSQDSSRVFVYIYFFKVTLKYVNTACGSRCRSYKPRFAELEV